MKVFEAIAAAIVAEGCTDIFGLVGDANLGVWGALGATPGVTLYAARHEAAAVSMAEGYARITGKVGVATVTRGPGLTHTSTSLIAAARGRSPLVLVAGDVPAGTKNTHQAMNQRQFAETCGARFRALTSADSVLEEVREAFYAASAHRFPLVLNLPTDIQDEEYVGDFDYQPSRSYLPARVGAPAPDAVNLLADALVAAERPVVIAGRGVSGPEAKESVVTLADRSGALLATTLLAKGLFAGHPYDIGIAGGFASAPTEELLAEADLVLSFGAELSYHTTEGGRMFPKARVARVDIDPAAKDISLVPGLFVQGDARATAVALAAELDARQHRAAGNRTAATDAVLSQEPASFEAPTDGLDPRALMRHMASALPADVHITCGIGHFWSFPAMYLPLPAGGSMQFSHHFGAIGQGLGFGIGGRVGTPGRPNILIEGDGSLMQHLQELETVVRHGLQLIVLVWNDAGYGAEVHKMRQKGMNEALAQWTSPDFVALARAFGGDGVILNDETQIANAIATGLKAGGLYLIDARVSPTTVSDPYRKLHLGQENRAPLLRPLRQGATRT